jgi:hypothetical protein
MTMRRGGGLLAAVLVLALTGCIPESSTRAGLVDGTVAIMVCRDMKIDSIVVTTYDGADSSEHTEVWAVSGEVQTLPGGTTVVLGETPPGFEVDLPYVDGTVDPDRQGLVVSLRLVGVRSDVASFGVATLEEGAWTDVNGRVRDSSC